jgi:NAD(P)H-hydrate epimerase
MSILPNNLYSSQQVRNLESIIINGYDIAGIRLMQRAAYAVFSCLKKRWGHVKHIAIFCGSGNNAGDGYLIASLALQANIQVSLYSISPIEKLTGNALLAYQDYLKQGGHCLALASSLKVDLVVDAMLGIGISREVTGDYARAIILINQTSCPVIAVDIPSGIHSDTGQVMAHAVKAEITVSFIGLKQGLFTGDAVDYCGEILFDDLSVPTEIFTQVNHSAKRLTHKPLAARLKNTHKGNYGHLLIIGGDVGFSGAVRLAAEAGLRSGSGLVSIATHPAHADLLNSGRFELMCRGITEAKELQNFSATVSVIVLGTGLGQAQWGQSLFNVAINSALPMIIDADGLNFLAQSPNYAENRILTPHPKEAARLLKSTTKEIIDNRFAAVKEIQAQYGGICLLKGAGTLITDGDESFINTTGNPGMATAGMGDVLAGIIGGLVAQKMSLIEATTQGTYIHGLAADFAAKQGERGLLSSDLMPFIRKLVN